MMPPYRELSMKVGEEQSFLLRDHDISVHYLQAEPDHIAEVMVDSVTKTITIEEHQVCPEKRMTAEKIIDKEGHLIGEEQTMKQEPCWYAWQEGELSFVTFLDSPDSMLRLMIALPPIEGDFTL